MDHIERLKEVIADRNQNAEAARKGVAIAYGETEMQLVKMAAATPKLIALLEMAEGALKEDINALMDYIQTIEVNGSSLNYGRSVLANSQSALAAIASFRKDGV